jgi:hypothetical protein
MEQTFTKKGKEGKQYSECMLTPTGSGLGPWERSQPIAESESPELRRDGKTSLLVVHLSYRRREVSRVNSANCGGKRQRRSARSKRIETLLRAF